MFKTKTTIKNKTTVDRATHIIDATNAILGRLASHIAKLLMGKHKSQFAYNKDVGDYVVVKNIKKLKFTGSKLLKKIYYTHSGYIGSLRKITLKEKFNKNPAEVLREAVLNMLPKNRLRKHFIKRLKFDNNLDETKN